MWERLIFWLATSNPFSESQRTLAFQSKHLKSNLLGGFSEYLLFLPDCLKCLRQKAFNQTNQILIVAPNYRGKVACKSSNMCLYFLLNKSIFTLWKEIYCFFVLFFFTSVMCRLGQCLIISNVLKTSNNDVYLCNCKSYELNPDTSPIMAHVCSFLWPTFGLDWLRVNAAAAAKTQPHIQQTWTKSIFSLGHLCPTEDLAWPILFSDLPHFGHIWPIQCVPQLPSTMSACRFNLRYKWPEKCGPI